MRDNEGRNVATSYRIARPVARPKHNAVLLLFYVAWPDADFVATDGLRHRGVLRDGAVIARVMEFASAQRPSGDTIARETAPG